jgi:hypothetical protein
MTALQKRIVDLLWTCQSQEEVNVVLRVFGIDAYIVREMMLAEVYDDVDDVALAQHYLKPYRLTGL